MSDNQNWNSMGEQIKDAVTEALRSGDFRNLNDLVSQTVVDTLNEVGKHIIPNDDGMYGKSRNTTAQSDIPLWQQVQQNERQKQAQQQFQEKERQRQTQQQNFQEKERQKQMQRRQEQLRQQEAQMRRRQEQLRQQEEQMRRRQEQLQRSRTTALSLVKTKKVGSVSGVLYQVFGGIGLGVTGIVTLVRLILLLTTAAMGVHSRYRRCNLTGCQSRLD